MTAPESWVGPVGTTPTNYIPFNEGSPREYVKPVAAWVSAGAEPRLPE